MSRTVYVNGQFVDEKEATVSIFDRGFLFSDAIYEVSAILNGKLVDNDAHLARMNRSLKELEIIPPVSEEQLVEIQHALIERNEVQEGLIYWQISRGADSDRSFLFPAEDVPSSLVMFTQKHELINHPKVQTGLSVVAYDDIRWKRRDIKTTQLLSSSMAKQYAKNTGFDDAWLVEDGFVTEGSSNNAHIVVDGTIITRPLSTDILHGITRKATLELAERENIIIEERPFTIAEALEADEAFITSASMFVMPVTRINKVEIGNGTPGPITKKLREIYLEMALGLD